ncbi:MAG TPA: DUF4180 domain-containing protein [Saprospiraceae bacterium]|nr:DUF4180 domain-containing protein [Saprospiraceae bacterium]HMQ82360.1 DUF4180 domain-containing protein [Saprospiraceae bacterium]
MQIETHQINGTYIAEIHSEGIILQTAQDGVEILGNLYYQGFDKIILQEKSITPEFFDLKNGMAGEVLQKFSNYRVRLAIVGDFLPYTGKSIQAFMHESNQTRHINFVDSVAKAIEVLL